jgi:uncharacterized membrane protein
MLAISLFIIICPLSFTSPILRKYGTQTTYSGVIVFDASGFGEGEEMHFSIKSYEGYFSSDTIHYFYIDEYSERKDYSTYSTHMTRITSTYYNDDYYYYYETKYFTIKKQKSEFGTATKGNYLYIYLPLYNNIWAEVSNTEEDEGKIEGWLIAVIVVIIVVIIVIVIICCCVRRIKMKKQLAQANAVAAANQANYVANQQYQAQVIQAQINQAQAQAYQDQVQAQIYQDQINQAQAQAYQAQMNQAQVYQAQVQTPDQGYQSNMNAPPPQPYQQNQGDFTNDVGYSSKAAAI